MKVIFFDTYHFITPKKSFGVLLSFPFHILKLQLDERGHINQAFLALENLYIYFYQRIQQL